MTDDLSGAAGDLAEKHPDVWSAYSALGSAVAKTGGLGARKTTDQACAGHRGRVRRGRAFTCAPREGGGYTRC